MRWVEHVAHMVWKRDVCRILSDNLKERTKWQMDNEVNVNKLYAWRVRTGFIWLRIGTSRRLS
jgi:hypothetical protein